MARRVLKNRVYHEPPVAKPMNHPLRIAEGKRKDLTHSLKNAIGLLLHLQVL